MEARLYAITSQALAEQSALCEGHLTLDEVHSALLGMARNKSPGSDGLPMEFYLHSWDVLGADLVDVLNASLDTGLLPFSQRSALIIPHFQKR